MKQSAIGGGVFNEASNESDGVMEHSLQTAQARDIIKNDWTESDYYAQAEGWLSAFWGEQTSFSRAFASLDLTRVVDLACGRGRHTEQILSKAGFVTLIDVNETNIEACKKRFAQYNNVAFLVGSGSDLGEIPSASQTALFCYDAMVHFELEDVISYLRDTYRILRPGGRALFHYSNYTGNPGGNYHDNPHWRNFGSEAVFKHFAMRVGFKVLSSETFSWGSDAKPQQLDALTLLERIG